MAVSENISNAPMSSSCVNCLKVSRTKRVSPLSLVWICEVEALGVGYFFEHLIRFVFLPTLQSSCGWLSQNIFVLRKLQNSQPHSLS